MRRLIPLAALVVAALVAACSPTATAVAPTFASTPGIPAALKPFYSQVLAWTACHGKLECATFSVPLDYAEPDGETLTITAARALATGTSRGPLVVNPGGPGGSGIEYISDPAYAVSSTARRNFDLVSFDPRGVGESTPLWCYRGAQLDAFLDIDPTPDTTAEGTAVVNAGVRLAAACASENAKLMAHVSTSEIARDMDILRGLLGEPRLRYLGKSWGTALGTVYAALFPGRVGSFVLDGAVDLQAPPVQALFDQGQGFEVAIGRFVTWCLDQGSCPLGTTKAQAKARLVRFIAGLDAHPLPTGDASRPLTEAQALTAVIGPLYVSGGGFDWLLTGLTPALELGKGRPLQTIFDWFVSRSANGRFSSNANTAIYAVNCLDGPAAISSTKQARTLAKRWGKQLPVMGAVMAWGDLPCAKWPYRAVIDVSKLRVRNVPPILVVSATYDPATPMKWGRALTRELPNSVLLIRDGDGHTSYANNNLCIDRAVDAFLLSADPASPDVPANGKRCG